MLDRRTGLVALFAAIAAFAGGWFVRGAVDAPSGRTLPPPSDLGAAPDPAAATPAPDGGSPSAPAAATTVEAGLVRVRIVAAGDVTVEVAGRGPKPVGNLLAPDDAAKRAALDALRDELAAVAKASPMRDPKGNSTMGVEVAVDGAAPWVVVPWVLQTAVHSSVRIRRIRLAPTDGVACEEILLPTDGGPDVPLYRRPATMTATLLAIAPSGDAGRAARIRIGAKDHAIPPPAATADAAKEAEALAALDAPFRGIDTQLVGVHTGTPSLLGEIAVPDPLGVPCRVGIRLVRAFQTAGFPDVRFQGAPFPAGAKAGDR